MLTKILIVCIVLCLIIGAVYVFSADMHDWLLGKGQDND